MSDKKIPKNNKCMYPALFFTQVIIQRLLAWFYGPFREG